MQDLTHARLIARRVAVEHAVKPAEKAFLPVMFAFM